MQDPGLHLPFGGLRANSVEPDRAGETDHSRGGVYTRASSKKVEGRLALLPPRSDLANSVTRLPFRERTMSGYQG